ncbi:hypothetical protein BV25DRAFT_1826410 [Artomyces pyxidatus]|uniref:Uncharacterized protein n=1 Tax=Artomyces pyxidatus TaxID=48021 RepID=A0ACB8SZR3_9AGAM|nr:hypothetical protein BV25DRAFT_1826410 [Artomyces pyxidatus]
MEKWAWEVAYAPASDAYKRDRTLVTPAYDLLRKYKGAHNLYHALELENPNILAIIGWDSIEAHETYESQNDGKDYKDYINFLVPALSGAAVPLHVFFIADPIPSFNAPVQEWAWVTAKANTSTQNVAAVLQKIIDHVNGYKSLPVGGSFGPIHETGPSTPQFVIVLGWLNLETMYKARLTSPLKELGDELNSKAELMIAHSNLIPYKNGDLGAGCVVA